jgi:hypothetical protein
MCFTRIVITGNPTIPNVFNLLAWVKMEEMVTPSRVFSSSEYDCSGKAMGITKYDNKIRIIS